MIRFSRVQIGMSIAAVALAVLCSCDKPSTSPLDLGTETASDRTGSISVDISLVARPDRESELNFTLKAVGIEEMDKVALEVVTDNMFLVEGGSQWAGFVPPRQPQSHRVVVKPVDDANDPHVRIRVLRFLDSEVLMQREVHFTPEGQYVPD